MRRRATKSGTAPALRRLGLATPPPFVGREEELAAIGRALREAGLVVVHGAVGSGKTRLALELIRRPDVVGSLRGTYVRCRPDDRAVALRARIERAVDALPGTLAEVLERESHVVVIDDVHHLPEEDAARFLTEIIGRRGEGRVVLVTRDHLPLRRDHERFEMTLDGLDEAAARELWTHHEEIYGPTAAGAIDQALLRTRGMPLALRREYARAAFGADAWTLDQLDAPVRAALEAVAVIRIPVAPAGVAAMAQGIDVESALIALVSRQLIDPLADGRFSIHDVVRDDVLAGVAAPRRQELERTAAQLVSSIGRGRADTRRLAWDAGDDGALALPDPVERSCEAVLHLIAAGDVAAAAERMLEVRAMATRRGGGGELLGLIEMIEARDARVAEQLAGLRADIAARHGRVAEALERAGGLDPVDAATLAFAAGDVAAALTALDALIEDADPATRCRAAAAAAGIELHCGRRERAEQLVTSAFERDRAEAGDHARARVHMALAAIEEHEGRYTAARTALARASSSGTLDAGLGALIEARRAHCLLREGRLGDAEKVVAEAERAAREVDAVGIADEVRRVRALAAARRGQLHTATEALARLAAGRRQRGDEVGALIAELDQVDVLVRRGELATAGEIGAACRTEAAQRGLAALEARAVMAAATIELAELRVDSARERLNRLAASPAAGAAVRRRAAGLLAEAEARSGMRGGAPAAAERAASAEGRAASAAEGDDLDAGRARIALALATGDTGVALDLAGQVAVQAERAGRTAEVAEALAIAARLHLSRGDRAAATAAASRAAREAAACGHSSARVGSLLVLAALARESDDLATASAYAGDASRLAAAAGLPVERLVAAEAIDAIAGGGSATGRAGDLRGAAAATMSPAALEAATRMLADLGLTASRPFRVVAAGGEESFVADASPDLLQMNDRILAVDGVRETVYRAGTACADLRRRSLLKRLLFLFARSPNKCFSKEEIVETVWNVEYHPLRHDAALFTNIMRIRRLLGEDGAELIRVSEDGYRFVPPKDYLFVEPVAQTE